MCFLEIFQPPPAPLYIWSLVSVFTRNWTPTSVQHRPNPFLLTVPPCLPSPTGARLPPSPARSIPYHPNHPPAAPPRPSKTSSFLSVHRGAWIVADFLWAHSVGHSQRENSLGESLFIFAVARDTWGKIVQLYLVHSSRPSAFPPLHPLPLHLNVYRLTPASFCFAYELKCIIFLTLFAIASLSFLLVSLFREVYRASWYT